MASHLAQRISGNSREYLSDCGEGLDELVQVLYRELHKQASRFVRRERAENSFQTTDLINEVYLKLVKQKNAHWHSRTHFFAVAPRLMRQILIDHARTKHRLKRGGNGLKLPLDEAILVADSENTIDLIALDEALTALSSVDETQARVVELRYFGGLTIEETAEALNVSHATVERDWVAAKVWLHHRLQRE
jgi:RNA polymerase sigma factor (TIGR02999 family)